jgi:hypothetical protein
VNAARAARFHPEKRPRSLREIGLREADIPARSLLSRLRVAQLGCLSYRALASSGLRGPPGDRSGRHKTGEIMAAEPGTVQFSIGRVIGDSFGVYARNFVSFSVLALLIGLVDLLFNWFFVASVTTGAVQDPAQMDPTQINWMPIILGGLISIIVGTLTQAAIIYGTFQDLRGQKASIGDCIARGLSAIVPVIVGSILLSLAVSIGFMLIFVPGLILLVMWWVYVPAIVVEGKGIIGAFGRSRELTRGRRWHIFGILVLVGIVMIAISWLIGNVVLADPTGGFGAGSIVLYLFSSLVTAYSAVLAAVGYYYLRAEKEGIDVNEIARIFD